MRSLLLLTLSFLSFTLSAQEAGIDFSHASFDELLAEAKAEDKLVFIDAYTTWCGPCKMMTAKVFPQEEVGKVYNGRFVNAKIDMEKGEGPSIAQRYSVNAYPTYLFVDGDGNLMHKAMGYIPAEALIALADDASGPKSLGAMNARYDGGDRDPAFVEEYLEVLSGLYERERADKVVQDYLASKDNWSEEKTLQLIIANPGEVGGERMNYLLTHADDAIELAGSGSYMMGLQQVLLTKYMREAGQRQLPPTAKILPFYSQHAAPLKDRLAAHYTMFQAEQMRDTETYISAAKTYLTAFPSNDFSELNSAAWNFYEQTEDPDDLKMALNWAQQSVAIDANYPNLDTLAWLYQKMGMDDKAKATAKRAIEMAKATDQDYSDTERILSM